MTAGAAPETAQSILEHVCASLQGLATQRRRTESLYEIGKRLLSEWERPVMERGAVTWPIHDLNERVGPLTSEYVVMAAHPSVGKTAFGCCMAVANALEKRRVGIKYIEATAEQIVPRLIAQLGKVNTIPLRRGNAPSADAARAIDAVGRLRDLCLSVDDVPATVEQLMAWGQLEKAAGSRLLIIDNMKHIIMRQTANMSRPEVFCHLSAGVKRIRDMTKLPVILLHHLNEGDKMSWSKDIERDADIIITMAVNEDETVLPSKENDWRGTWIVDLSVEKSRDGQAGFTLKTRFNKEYQMFENYREPIEVPDEWKGEL
jgi:replicative DNA helicase